MGRIRTRFLTATLVMLTCLPPLAADEPSNTAQAALAQIQEAIRGKDRETLIKMLVMDNAQAATPGKAIDFYLLQGHGGPPGADLLRNGVLYAAIRQVDNPPPWDVLDKLRGSKVPFDEAVRLLGSVESSVPGFESKGVCMHIVALAMIRRGDAWQLYWGSMAPFQNWEYKVDTPVGVRKAVRYAQDRGDLASVYDLIDPDLRQPIGRDDFVREVHSRLPDYKVGGETPRAMGTFSGSLYGCEADEFEQDGRHMARVYLMRTKTERDTHGVQTFVQVGDRWYWRPGPECTAWPVGVNAPTSRPAGGSTNGASGTGGESPRATGSQPASNPGRRDLDQVLEAAKAAWARQDYGMAERLARPVVKHPQATDEQKRRAQLILDRVAESRAGAPASQPGTSATQPAAPPATQPSSAPTGPQP